ncbi:unnamed protein product [Miscanthus lutarioriparius]|uniref:non-specific serine/threonine protein kinase n=1 Tax=Miscanthus lutarioriparius TaxID=422564 RepID=A0A811NPQ6_9POAL|nr:unnamed protein product [Miscanthus lutarioriparius]
MAAAAAPSVATSPSPSPAPAPKVASPKAGDRKVVPADAVEVEEKHVLAVDDSSVDRTVIAKILRSSKYRDMEGRLELLALGLLPDVNMIITDYWMPGMTGYELLKHGPSYAFGFFSTNHQAPPCNSGGIMTSVVEGIPQVVWSANRGQPVGEGASTELTSAGNLVLCFAPGGAVVWSAGTAGWSVAAMAVARDGNLVLLDARNATVWQSFDHPTDALLVGQSLRQGARLVANSSAADWSASRQPALPDRCQRQPQRLRRRQAAAAIGASDVFAVPGDFNLTLLDYLIAEPGLSLAGCCNELNAEYARSRELPSPTAAPPAAAAAVVIDVEETQEERIIREETDELMRIGSVKHALRSKSGRAPAQFPHSHSTGHSLAVAASATTGTGTGAGTERFTLRLPDSGTSPRRGSSSVPRA